MDIFSKAFKIKSALSVHVHAEMGCLFNKEKKTMLFLLLWKPFLVLNIDSNAASYFLLSHRLIYSSAGRLAEQFSGSQAAPLKLTFRSQRQLSESRNKLPEESLGMIFTCKKFHNSKQKFYFGCSSRNNSQSLCSPSALVQKVLVWFLEPLEEEKNYSSPYWRSSLWSPFLIFLCGEPLLVLYACHNCKSVPWEAAWPGSSFKHQFSTGAKPDQPSLMSPAAET